MSFAELGRWRSLLLATIACASLLILPTSFPEAGNASAQTASRWQRLPLAPAGADRATRASDGSLWIRASGRHPDPDGSPPADGLARYDAEGRLLFLGAASSFVEAERRELLQLGSVEELWSVDPAGRVWLGPRYHDGRRWTWLERDRQRDGLALRWSPGGALDPSWQYWVAFEQERSCPESGVCLQQGIQAFDAAGAIEVQRQIFDPEAEAARYALRSVFLLPDPEAEDVLPALALRALHRPPRQDSEVDYPLLGPPEPGQLRNAGYRTAAARDAAGRPTAILYVEEQLPEGIRRRHLGSSWSPASGWDAPRDLAEGPLFEAAGVDPSQLRLVAADRMPAPAGSGAPGLWLASSAGGLAFRGDDGRWGAYFSAREIGLAPGERILDVTGVFAEEGPRIFLVSDSGSWYYGPELSRHRLLLPLVTKGR